MTERLLIAGVLGLMSGIACRSFFVVSLPLVLLIGLLSCLGLFVAQYYRVRYVLIGVTFLFLFVLGVVRVSFMPSALPDTFASLLGKSVTLEGVVDADPDVRETSQRVTVLVSQDGVETRTLVVAPLFPSVSYGDTVEVSGTLSSPEPFDTAGGRTFAYPKFLAKDEIFSMLPQAQVAVRDTAPPLGRIPLRALYQVRHWFETGVSRALPEPMSALAMGLLTGGKQGLGESLLLAFTLSGLLPIVVLSGYNVMIVAEQVQRMFAFLPRRAGVFIAGVTVLLFVLASGAGSSAVRAGIMAGVALFARATGRTYDALRALVFVLVVMVLLQPLVLVYDPGFQFSFMATLGLILLSPLVARHLLWIRSTLIRETLATTIAAQVCVLPLLLYETGNLSLVAIPANLLVLPVIPLAMLLSFVAGIVGLVVPPLAPLVGVPAYAVLWYVIEAARVTASLPLSSFVLSAFPFWVVILSYLFLFGLFLHVKNKSQAVKLEIHS